MYTNRAYRRIYTNRVYRRMYTNRAYRRMYTNRAYRLMYTNRARQQANALTSCNDVSDLLIVLLQTLIHFARRDACGEEGVLLSTW